MPKQITTTVYEYHELGKDAQEKAREWYRENALDHEWWDYSFEDFNTIASGLGFNLQTPRARITIFFSGFCSQGDGACIVGTFRAENFNLQKLTDYLGDIDKHPDKELARIIGQFQELCTKHPALCATLTHKGRYSHERSVAYTYYEEVETENGTEDILNSETASAFEDCARDFMRWIYRSLETEHDYLLSDEHIAETIAANNYTFTATGRYRGE